MKIDWFLVFMVVFIVICLTGVAPTDAAAYGYRMPSDVQNTAPKFKRHADFQTALDCTAYHFIMGTNLRKSGAEKLAERHFYQSETDHRNMRAMNETGAGTNQMFLTRVMNLQEELKNVDGLMDVLHRQCPIEE